MDYQPSLRLKKAVAFGVIFIIWGSTYLAIKYAVETIPPFLMMGVRSFAAGAVLYLWGRSRGGTVHVLHWRAILIIGAAFFLVGHGLLAWAQMEVPSGFAALLIASEPLLIMVIESVVLKDSKVKKLGMIGLGLGFAGMTILVLSTRELGLSETGLLGVLAILIATFSWGGGAVYSRVAVLPKSPAVAAGLELLAGGVMLILLSCILGEPAGFELQLVTPRSLWALGYLILLGSVVTFSAYVWLLTVTSATRVSTHTYINPIVAIIIGWAVAGEPLTLSMATATVLIVTAVYLVLRDQAQLPR